MRKVYYNSTDNKAVIDITGQKTLEQIKAEFGDYEYQVLALIEHTEAYKIVNGVATKFTLAE